eukprot:scaffold1231_cov187-Pinguiococcus_pyrenoidosus.AAC.26
MALSAPRSNETDRCGALPPSLHASKWSGERSEVVAHALNGGIAGFNECQLIKEPGIFDPGRPACVTPVTVRQPIRRALRALRAHWRKLEARDAAATLRVMWWLHECCAGWLAGWGRVGRGLFCLPVLPSSHLQKVLEIELAASKGREPVTTADRGDGRCERAYLLDKAIFMSNNLSCHQIFAAPSSLCPTSAVLKAGHILSASADCDVAPPRDTAKGAKAQPRSEHAAAYFFCFFHDARSSAIWMKVSGVWTSATSGRGTALAEEVQVWHGVS